MSKEETKVVSPESPKNTVPTTKSSEPVKEVVSDKLSKLVEGVTAEKPVETQSVDVPSPLIVSESVGSELLGDTPDESVVMKEPEPTQSIALKSPLDVIRARKDIKGKPGSTVQQVIASRSGKGALISPLDLIRRRKLGGK